MSEDTPGYSVHDRREVIQPIFPGYVPGKHQPCHHCMSPGHPLTIHDPPALDCIAYLRREIGTLQGEVLALRLQLGAFAPEPQTAAEVAIEDAAMWPEPLRTPRVVAPGEEA